MNQTVETEAIMRRRYAREVWVGVLVVLGTTALLVALFMFTSPSMFRGRYEVTAVARDAGGARRNDEVHLRGVTIGRVRGFKILSDGVAMTLEMLGDYPVPKDSTLEIKQSSVLGEVTLEVIPGTSSEPLKAGDVIAANAGPGLFSSVAGEAAGALDRIRALLSEQTVANVEEGTGRAVSLLIQLGDSAEELKALIGSLNRTAVDIERATSGSTLERAVANIDSLTDRLDGVAASLDRSGRVAEDILARMARGEGSLGRLSRDETLYLNATAAAANLNKAATEIGRLAADVRRNPKRYFSFSVF